MRERTSRSGGRNLGEILNSPEYQSEMEQRIIHIVKLLIWEIFEKGTDFEDEDSATPEEAHGRKAEREVMPEGIVPRSS